MNAFLEELSQAYPYDYFLHFAKSLFDYSLKAL
ncbi:transposase family protein [Streptococcus pneumoniae]|nr:transposase family protein [Streptococcus pneumoniae]